MHKTIMMALLLACGTAHSSDWVSIGKSTDGITEAFVDIASIRISGDIRRAWAKLVYRPHTEKGSIGNHTPKWVFNYTSRMALNCREEAQSTEALTIYFEDGTNDSEVSQKLPYPWSPVPPDTSLSNLLQFVCAWKPK